MSLKIRINQMVSKTVAGAYNLLGNKLVKPAISVVHSDVTSKRTRTRSGPGHTCTVNVNVTDKLGISTLTCAGVAGSDLVAGNAGNESQKAKVGEMRSPRRRRSLLLSSVWRNSLRWRTARHSIGARGPQRRRADHHRAFTREFHVKDYNPPSDYSAQVQPHSAVTKNLD